MATQQRPVAGRYGDWPAYDECHLFAHTSTEVGISLLMVLVRGHCRRELFNSTLETDPVEEHGWHTAITEMPVP